MLESRKVDIDDSNLVFVLNSTASKACLRALSLWKTYSPSRNFLQKGILISLHLQWKVKGAEN